MLEMPGDRAHSNDCESEMTELASDQPAPEGRSIHAQLELILGSAEFRASDRGRDFLRYVIDEALAGRARRLKGYAIAVSVFGRDESFDPAVDPVVRLEARRLRRELEHYYLTAGRNDPVRISIPKGAYVPTFEFVEGLSDSPDRRETRPPDGHAQKPRRRSSIAVAATSGVLVALAVAAGFWFSYERGSEPAPDASGSAVPSFATPIVAVLPLTRIGASDLISVTAAGFTEDIVTDLARVTGLRVIAYSSSSRYGSRDLDVSEVGAALGATHLLTGSFQSDGEDFRVNIRLIDVAAGEQIWARRFDDTDEGIISDQGGIAEHVSAALSVTLLPGETGGDRDGLQDLEARALYRQAITLVNPPSDPARFVASQALLQRTIELDPGSPDSYAGLAFVLALKIWFGHAEDLDAAFAEINRQNSRALAIDPGNAQARITDSLVSMLVGEHDQAVRQCRSAIEARPSSSHAHGYCGIMLTFAGRPAEGIELLETAIRLDPVNPRVPFFNMLGVAKYHAGDYAGALDALNLNIARSGPFGAHMLVYVAATQRALGDDAGEREALEELRNYPTTSWVAEWLRRAFRNPRDFEPLMAILATIDRPGSTGRRASFPATTGTPSGGSRP